MGRGCVKTQSSGLSRRVRFEFLSKRFPNSATERIQGLFLAERSERVEFSHSLGRSRRLKRRSGEAESSHQRHLSSTPRTATLPSFQSVNSPSCPHHRHHIPSTQFATINPGRSTSAALASLSRSSRFGSLTCGTNRKIGTTVRPARRL